VGQRQGPAEPRTNRPNQQSWQAHDVGSRSQEDRGFAASEMAQTEGCMTRTVQSGLPLNNIPIINLFREFQLWDKWIRSEQRQFASGHI